MGSEELVCSMVAATIVDSTRAMGSGGGGKGPDSGNILR